ncbi:MAG: uroporphyrinogen decarboxylase family protein [Thermoproteota archaeon]
MNHRERFLRTFHFKEVDRVPDYEFGYWAETIQRWHKEGLPQEIDSNRDVELYFKLEGFDCAEFIPIRTGFWPDLPGRIVKETDDSMILEDGMGGIYEQKRWSSSVPHYLRYPLKNRDDWNRLRSFFDPDTPGRFPLNWDEVAHSYKERDYPLGISIGSLYGWLRNWMGVQNISLAFYKDSEWIAEMMDTLTELWLRIIQKALKDVQVDFATWWEDMCYSRGPLLSVNLFEEFMVPRYKKVTSLLAEYGVDINILDCDGRITELVPGWLRGGINCMFPIEAAHTDVYELRSNFNSVLLMGAVNKLSLFGGKGGIDREIKRLAPLLEEGGYIPTVDHRVPPEVSLENYVYYLKKKRRWIRRTDV